MAAEIQRQPQFDAYFSRAVPVIYVPGTVENPDSALRAGQVTVIGAGLGIAAGIGIAALIEAATPMPASIAPWSLIVAVVMGAGVGIGAGLYPANRAAKMDPVYAMGHD